MENNTTPEKLNSFNKGMLKDPNESYIGEGVWTHARNLVNNSHDGQMNVVGNEPSNKLCVTLPYTLIGCIASADNEWILFTTDNTNSEIGILNESECKYTKLVNNPCLNFNTKHLITGAARRTYDCSVKVYWADGNNPDRVLDIHNIPWKKTTTVVNGCVTYTNTTQLDCEQLRLAPLLNVPCVRLEKATGSGTLLNGTYQVAIAYMVNEIKVTDYLVVSNPVSIWDHSGVGGAVNLTVTNTDPDFTEMEVVVISVVNGQTVAKQLGVYSTHQTTIYIDNIDPTLVNISLDVIPLITPALEKSDGIFPLNNYLLKTGIYTKPDFNYQPLANQIVTKWVSVRYPQDYYHKGGANVGYMRDEVYSFFIRWVYNTGDRSASYHIPGVASGVPSATVNLSGSTPLSDGGVPVQEGLMDYWESTEKYPDDNPTVWNSFPSSSGSQYNLCGQKIRHHKFPDNATIPHFDTLGIYVLGVKFQNIILPKDINGNIITSIVGYEILRGSREGYKSVIAKGLVNNIKQYDIVDANTNASTGQTVLMQNYPYNDISSGDPFYEGAVNMTPLKDYASFHSPDTTFQNPYIGKPNLKIYGYVSGTMLGVYETPYKHPEFKILGKRAVDIANVFSAIAAVTNVTGLVLGASPLTIQATQDLPMSTTIGIPNKIGDGVAGAATMLTIGGINAILYATYSFFIGIKLDAQKIADLITGLIPTEQYATQFNSHGYYNTFIKKTASLSVNDYGYIKNNVQSFNGRTVNNLYRDPYVILNLGGQLPNAGTDNSLTILANNGDGVIASISSNYGALKVNFLSQYGQIDSIRQIPISSCVYNYLDQPILFGGDTYINRYTEKNQYLFFNDWLVDQPQDYVYNYLYYQNIVGTKYFVDNRKTYSASDDSALFDPFIHPYKFYRLNQGGTDIGKDTTVKNGSGFRVKPGYFYLFCNGVRDFFVESEVNVGYRDWDDEISKRFYDPYGFTDLSGMFRSDIIKYSSGWYKYDYSLSVSRMYNQFISWGQVLSRSFDPQVAATCYAYYPRRIQYSLPQQEELKRDNWQSFLVNNYKDMPDEITCVKPINKTGSLIMLRTKSPIQLMGVDSLQTDTGIKVTIGDGGLFNQPLQSLVNSDEIYQYGSCQNRWSITSTPQGVFYVSQDQGKVFLYTGSLQEISKIGLKWWFSRYLPSYLKKLYPDYEYGDNPVMGCGVVTVYDNINEIVYITKRDFIPKSDKIKYLPGYGFYMDTLPPVSIPDPYSPAQGYGCPDGYAYVNGVCTQITTSAPLSASSTPVVLSPVAGSNTYGTGGTLIYNNGFDPTTGVGPYINIGINNPLWINNVPQATISITSTTGEFDCGNSTLIPGNYVSMVGTNTGSGSIAGYTSGSVYKVYSVTGNYPYVTKFVLTTLTGERLTTTIGSISGVTYNTLVGPVNGLIRSSASGTISYRYLLNRDINKTYYVALTGWQGYSFKIKVDDNYVLQSNPTTMASYLTSNPESKYLHIYPISLLSGGHTIEMEGNYRGLGAMIIDNTAEEIANATSLGDLNILFTSKNLTNFNNYTYPSCAGGATQEKIPGTNNYKCITTSTLSPEYTFIPLPPLDRPVRRPINVCDPAYFEDASWTISYDVKNNQWISFHDWHPSFMLPTKRHFLTAYNQYCNVSQTGLWRHNDRWDDFCNFYGKYYPFEVEYAFSTGTSVTTMKNVEYYLETYKYGTNGQDKFHLLDYNFDSAIVYNSEQTSGLLHLNLKSKSNPFNYLNYPITNPTGSTEILFSKEEQKYRFNQFNDITKDRGEFTNAENILTTTSSNGYTWFVNPFAVDYYKDPLQRKKFRHNVSKVLLRKNPADLKLTGYAARGDIKMIFKFINTKLQISQK